MDIKSEINTLIGAGTTVEGDINIVSSSRIDGIVRGKVESEATLVLGSDAKVYGDIHSDTVIIGGKVVGNVYAKNSVVLEARSSLTGDLHTGRIQILEGAKFNGTCKMHKKE